MCGAKEMRALTALRDGMEALKTSLPLAIAMPILAAMVFASTTAAGLMTK